jgi:hypothetical protein
MTSNYVFATLYFYLTATLSNIQYQITKDAQELCRRLPGGFESKTELN